MKPQALLKANGIEPVEPVLLITAEEALTNLTSVVEEYCPNVRLDKLSKKELMALLESYGQCVMDYHPENEHQERGTILRSVEILKKYGLTEDDIQSIDFY